MGKRHPGGGRRGAARRRPSSSYYADNGPRFLEPKPIDVMQGEAVVVNEPTGVILAIEPWNYPLYQVVRVAGPNLTLGNTILLKHAENNPQCALALERLFRDAGAPEGVYTNLFLRIADVEQVIANKYVQGVTLTGSERAGSSVAQLAGKHLKKSVLELGGSDPFIVLDAPDVGRTVKAATMARMANTGQACIAAKRIIVLDDVFDDVVGGLKQAFSTFTPGDPADPSTTLGPLSSERAAQDLAAQIQDAVDKGATVLAGGGRPDRRRLRRGHPADRRHAGHARLPRGALRSGRCGLPGRRRGRGHPAGQRQRLRALRGGLLR